MHALQLLDRCSWRRVETLCVSCKALAGCLASLKPVPTYCLKGAYSSAAVGYVDQLLWKASVTSECVCGTQVLLRPDERYGVVRFAEAESAVKALQALNGTSICGEALIVTTTDPLAGARNSKRPRVAE